MTNENDAREPQDDFSAMMSVHALCPTDLSHPDKMRWMASEFRKRTATAEQAPRLALTDEQIRDVFMANGFTIKEGQTDLKPYVYAAARALLARCSPAAAPAPDGLTKSEVLRIGVKVGLIDRVMDGGNYFTFADHEEMTPRLIKLIEAFHGTTFATTGAQGLTDLDERIKAAIEAVEDQDNHAALAILRTILAAPRQPGEMGAGVQCNHDMRWLGNGSPAQCQHCGKTASQISAASAQQEVKTYSNWPSSAPPTVTIGPASAQQDERDARDEQYARIFEQIAEGGNMYLADQVRGHLMDAAIYLRKERKRPAYCHCVDCHKVRAAQQVQADAEAVYQYSDEGENWTDVDWMTYQSIDSQFKRVVYTHQAESGKNDGALLDYLQRTGSTVSIAKPTANGWEFMVGGLPASTHSDIRVAIRAAMSREQSGGDSE